MFVVDSSDPVTYEDYIKEKEFVKSMVNTLNLSPGKTRATFITYGENPRVVVKFDGYRDKPSFNSFVDRAPRQSGRRRIDRALDSVANILRESRPDVPKAVVLLTAGRQTPARDAKTLDEAAKPLRDLGAKTYVIAIGREPSRVELLPVVEKPEDIFSGVTFDALISRVIPIARIVAQGKG